MKNLFLIPVMAASWLLACFFMMVPFVFNTLGDWVYLAAFPGFFFLFFVVWISEYVSL